MLLQAFAKVNLDLRVLGPRPDGYHEVRTVLQTIDWSDEIVMEPSDRFSFDVSVQGNAPSFNAPPDETNLVVRAVREFERVSGAPAQVRIELRKRIPIGAGLGGGSADAAVTVLGLQKVLGRPLPEDNQLQCLRALGADVPFFAAGGRALCTGRGDRITPLDDRPEDAALHIVIVNPGVFVGTAEAYSWLTMARRSNSIKGFCAELVPGNPDKDQTNDFEGPVFARYPLLAEIKQGLLNMGAVRASLSGSGSAIFGVFGSGNDASSAASRFREKFEVRMTRILPRPEYLRRVFGD
jgi:4-diphosphocytidyl-2-C-methyl-D-erythritol kinase